MRGHEDGDGLEAWLEEGYARSFRTACLILGNRSDAEEAVQEAFLRAWRFRASLDTGAAVKPWLYRVVVNTCNSKLREEIPHRDRRSDSDLLAGMSSIDDPPGRVACHVTWSMPYRTCQRICGSSSSCATTPT